jgi:hypothetical protein
MGTVAMIVEHDKQLAVHEQRLNDHEDGIQALVNALEKLRTGLFNTTVAVILTMLTIGGGIIAALVA